MLWRKYVLLKEKFADRSFSFSCSSHQLQFTLHNSLERWVGEKNVPALRPLHIFYSGIWTIWIQNFKKVYWGLFVYLIGVSKVLFFFFTSVTVYTAQFPWAVGCRKKYLRIFFFKWYFVTKICKMFEITRTIYSSCLVTECFLNSFLVVSHMLN